MCGRAAADGVSLHQRLPRNTFVDELDTAAAGGRFENMWPWQALVQHAQRSVHSCREGVLQRRHTLLKRPAQNLHSSMCIGSESNDQSMFASAEQPRYGCSPGGSSRGREALHWEWALKRASLTSKGSNLDSRGRPASEGRIPAHAAMILFTI